ncbi:MAG: protein arginine kinase [Planctomycetota bacterium]
MGISDPTGPSGPRGPLGEIDFGTAPWLGGGDASDVVVSSRVRLARNVASFRFVGRSSAEDRLAVLDMLRSRLGGDEILPGRRSAWLDVHQLTRLERALLVERHLISPQHARGQSVSVAEGGVDPRAVVVSLPDEGVSIMVNEEDHLRLQAIRPGLTLSAALDDLESVDDGIEASIDYAYSARFGYLTACPTNVGTGARMSVMLHLPALRILGEIEKVKRAASDMALAVRGFWGEGSEAEGDFYQISNQTTLGKSERETLDELERVIVPKVVDYERRAREQLMSRRGLMLEDTVFRALGVLQHARRMKTGEAMQRLSEVRLGASLGQLSEPTLDEISQLLIVIHPAHLQRAVGRTLTQDERRTERATLLRSRLAPAR